MEDDRTALMTARALAPGYEVLWYTIKDVLGQGGFGITYRATDRNLDRDVAIKEYLPTPFAYRHQDYSVKPLTGDHHENFAWGLDSFLKEAQTLAKFKHDNIVQVHSVFEQNNTAYMVMAYEHGDSLSAIYKNQPRTDQAFFEGIFFPIFEGLVEIHNFGFIHRDIKPANIYIRENQTPVLIDFGSARQTSQQQTGEMTTLVSQGYTPLEQYSSNYGEQGPWTDVYALAASMYEGIVGRKPDESLSRSACMLRSKPDTVQRLTTQDYPGFSQPFLDAVLVGLELEPEKRPQDLNEWLAVFRSEKPAQMGGSFGNFSAESGDDTTVQQPVVNITSKPETQRTTGAKRDIWGDSGQSDFPGETAADESDMDRPATRKIDAPKKKTGKGMLFGGMAAALMVGIGIGGWFMFGPGTKSQVIDKQFLATMPAPSVAFDTFLPKERVKEQLDDLSVVSTFYNEAQKLNANDARLVTGVEESYAQLKEIASTWNPAHHEDIANEVERIANLLPGKPQQRQEIAGLLSGSTQRASYDTVLQLLDSKKIVSPAGESVLDLATRLSKQDFDKIRQTDQWSSMIRQFRTAAIEKLESSDFDGAARVVEAALAIDPMDTQMNAVRDHLALR